MMNNKLSIVASHTVQFGSGKARSKKINKTGDS
jgi:hypothetical protein